MYERVCTEEQGFQVMNPLKTLFQYGVIDVSNNTSSVQAVYNMVKNQGDKASRDVLIKAQTAKQKILGLIEVLLKYLYLRLQSI